MIVFGEQDILLSIKNFSNVSAMSEAWKEKVTFQIPAFNFSCHEVEIDGKILSWGWYDEMKKEVCCVKKEIPGSWLHNHLSTT